jgi:hypothetical protein
MRTIRPLLILVALALAGAPVAAQRGKKPLGAAFAGKGVVATKPLAGGGLKKSGGTLGQFAAKQRKTNTTTSSSTKKKTLVVKGSAVEEYNDGAGENRPKGPFVRDRYGNAEGGDFDLARDGAFLGQVITVVQLYREAAFDFVAPTQALSEKGFVVDRKTFLPNPDDLAQLLRGSSQLWIISGQSPTLSEAHLKVVTDFFRGGRGLFLWGDNSPYHGEANQLALPLFGASMNGFLMGDQTVGIQRGGTGPGLVQDKLLTTGIEQLYEGITIPTLAPGSLKPLFVGSAGNLVAAYHDAKGERAIVDGGFTRLYYKWDTAGTARYLKNAAAWLANKERFR